MDNTTPGESLYNRYNGREVREHFNSEVNQNWHVTTWEDRQEAAKRVDDLIETTRRELESDLP
jgi:hypothetical protein